MSQKIYLNILKFGSIMSFFCVLFVFKNLLFPFITSKQLPFNILVEILFVFWLAFILKFPQWNPFRKTAGGKRRQAITWGVLSFAAGITASLFVSVDFNLSFWGDVERMLGIFHILHFFALYLIIITVFRDWRDWKFLLIALFSTSVIVALEGLDDTKSTIGNNAYVAAFMMFGVWISGFLFFKAFRREARAEFQLLKWLYLLPFPLLFLILYRTDISGVFVGMAAGIFSGVFLYGISNNNKKARNISLAVFTVLIIAFVIIFINRRDIPRISSINFQKNTFQTRLISWKAGWDDFHNHPLLGVGWGNFAIIFDKYFKASFYDHSRSETYFDRAHNNVVDIASTTGFVGIASYLSIFIFLAFYLIKLRRSGRIGAGEFAFWSSLFIAYFVQNLAVFDSFVTYLCFMVFLGYIHWLANTREDQGNEKALLPASGDSSFDNKEIAALFFSGLAMILVIYQANILPWKMLIGVIDGQTAFGQGNFEKAFASYEKAFNYDTPLDRDGRSIFVRTIVSNINKIAASNSDLAGSLISYAIEQSEKNVALNPQDNMMLVEQARLYAVSAQVVTDKKTAAEYLEKAIENIDSAIAVSPERIPVYFFKAQFLIEQGKIGEAVSILEYARKFNEKYYETDCQLGQIYLLKADSEPATSTALVELTDKGYAALGNCLDSGGADMLVVEKIIAQAINYYLAESDLKKSASLYERMTDLHGDNYKIWINLARLYQEIGEKEKAAYSANKAAEIEPSLKSDVEEFIKQLR
jgi:tetratricopeptide (TPR) repeat protein